MFVGFAFGSGQQVMTAVYAETEGIATEEGVVSFSDLSQYHPNPAVYCKEAVRREPDVIRTARGAGGEAVVDDVANLLRRDLLL